MAQLSVAAKSEFAVTLFINVTGEGQDRRLPDVQGQVVG